VKPDYKTILNTVLQVLNCYQIRKIPVDLFSIIAQVPNLNIHKYSDTAVANGVTVQDICNTFRSNYGVYIRDRSKNRHSIFYNDVTRNEGLLRFTIAHELGHFFLLHADTEEIEYDTKEYEANFFARNLLAPVPLVERVLSNDKVNTENIKCISLCFQISYEAAQIRMKSYQQDKEITAQLAEKNDFFDEFQIFHPFQFEMV